MSKQLGTRMAPRVLLVVARVPPPENNLLVTLFTTTTEDGSMMLINGNKLTNKYMVSMYYLLCNHRHRTKCDFMLFGKHNDISPSEA